MERKFKFAPGEFYHIYNRGSNKANIFLSDGVDQKRFQKLLYLCNSSEPVVFKDVQLRPLNMIKKGPPLVDIGAYCLMPNHFHLLVREKEEGGTAKFMAKLSTGYSMYFNKKNERTGTLFEGRFKAKHVDSDEYLKYLFAYIHLNPIKIIDPDWKDNGISDLSRAEEYLSTYQYSSCFDYMGQNRREEIILNKEAFPEYFMTPKNFNDFTREWLTYNDSEN